MSVMMETISSSHGVDRRTAARLRPAGVVRVTIGRGIGTILDVSSGGMKVRHTGSVRRSAFVRVAFSWESARFDGTAEVLSSHVKCLGDLDHESTIYETRLRFLPLEHESKEVLQRVLSATSNEELRRWVANLHGWTDAFPDDTPARPGSRTFIRCVLIGSQWRKTSTQDRTQPVEGFLLPSTVSAGEAKMLCDTYARASADARHLIRLTAAAVVEEAA